MLMKKLFMLFAILAVNVSMVVAQIKVQGVVLDESKTPVIGASVRLKNDAKKGTATNVNGKFEITVPENSILVVSSLGYKTREVKATPTMQIILESTAEELQEVVVTGYGVTKKRAFTGSAQVVDSKEITRVTNTDPMQALTGQIAGFQISTETGQPGGYNSVQIRGLGSFNSGTQPLYVIDGVPITTGRYGMRESEGSTINPLANINPNDILTMSVLKDAAATSIYGARASNGVIVITTKQGSAGKAKINFTAKVGMATMPDIGNAKMLNTDQWLDFIELLSKNSGYVDATATRDNIVELLKGEYGFDVDPNQYTDWFKEVTRSGFTQEYNVDISGGTEQSKYFVSGGYYDEMGTVIGKDIMRYSGRVNLEATLSEYVKFGINTSAAYSMMNGGTGGGYYSDPITQANMQLPISPVKLADGSWNFNTPSGYNPVAQRSEYGDRNEAKQIKAVIAPWITAKYKDFIFTSRYGLDFYNVKEFGRWSMLQPQGRDEKIVAEEGNSYTTLWTWSNTLNYIKQFGELHNINVLLGQEAQKATYESAYMSNKNFPTDLVFTLENGSKPSDASTSISNYSLLSFFGNAEYDFANKYYLSASLRRDASSRVGANQRWGLFWSLGGKYRISQEEFMEATKSWLTKLVAKASYGTTGNQDIGWYQALGTYRFGYNYLNRPGMKPYRIANPDLKWERTKKFNAGIELSLFDRINLDVDYYINTTEDMLFEVPLTRATGFASIMQNVGSMENKGIEVVLGITPFKSKNFTWDVSLNMTHNKNKIVRLSTDKPIEATYTIREAGRPYHQFKMKEYAGVDPETGKQQWYKGETGTEKTFNYNEAGKRYLGVADPTVYGGFSNTFRFFDFDLNILFSYSFGGKVYNSAARYDENSKSIFANTTEYVYKNMWRNKGDVTNVPSPHESNISSHSSQYLMDGSYIKLKSMQLGYNVPSEFVSKLGVGSARLFMSADNLMTWALGKDFRGMDPEAESSGIIWWNYPVPRKVMFGVSLGF